MGHLLLVTGGTRSGKSRYALHRARAWGERILYVATCQPADEEMRQRVRRHQAERPRTWMTIEPGLEVVHAIQQHSLGIDGIVLDCLTLYVSQLLVAGIGEHEIVQRVDALCAELREVSMPVAIVTNEVGWGVVPETPLGRLFRDAAGRANQVAADYAQEVVLLVSGLPVVIKQQGRIAQQPWDSPASPSGRGMGGR
ncbi:MAG TPA: bifunctional adenosylcobinamide kinase/adenosylcobinamide-phosphate guanylyltransferase [Alphaproteobacteria bacterium]|nr:bifunctional adenosylcobinamide kinase/adenosylcobinamide-phosphate guanylyltransferase [Alphaproteobacteria bacterium]